MINIFVSYSHADERWVSDGEYGVIPWVQRSLKRKNVRMWYDHALRELPGEDYRRKITQEIDQSHIAILLISQDFLNSDFIREVEIPRIKHRLDKDLIKIVPILVSSTVWEAEDELDWIADRQMVPSDINPLSDYIGDPARWQSVRAQILRSIINRLPQMDERVSNAEAATKPQTAQDAEPGNVEIVIAPQSKQPFQIEALVVEEDRYQVLSGDQKELNEDGVDGSRIEKDIQDITPQEPGDCIVAGEKPTRFHAIIHDLDQSPTWKEEWIAQALENIFHEISHRQISSIGLPILGTVHGNLSTSKFAAIFNKALKEATIAHPLKVWIMAEESSHETLNGLLKP